MVSIEQKAKISEGLVQDEYRYLVYSDEVVLVWHNICDNTQIF